MFNILGLCIHESEEQDNARVYGNKWDIFSLCFKCIEWILILIGGHARTSECVWPSTHAERPSTSSLVGMMPFLLRTAATLSTSPRSTAFISRSSYLFQSVF